MTALLAPRSLKAPISWKFSHLKNTSAPVSESNSGQRITGVRRMNGAIRAAAACISAKLRTSCMHGFRGASGKRIITRHARGCPPRRRPSHPRRALHHRLGRRLLHHGGVDTPSVIAPAGCSAGVLAQPVLAPVPHALAVEAFADPPEERAHAPARHARRHRPLIHVLPVLRPGTS